MSAPPVTAIPTLYRGIQLRSRMEAQCALLFDLLEWEWQYEPQGYMLPSGKSYMPDFYLPGQSAIVECRGYTSERSDELLHEFGNEIEGGAITAIPAVRRYIVIKENDMLVFARRRDFHDACLVVYCDYCNAWALLGLGEGCCHKCGCHGCSITRAYVLSVKAGKVLLNQKTSEYWDGMGLT